jgi:hypothetical protein
MVDRQTVCRIKTADERRHSETGRLIESRKRVKYEHVGQRMVVTRRIVIEVVTGLERFGSRPLLLHRQTKDHGTFSTTVSKRPDQPGTVCRTLQVSECTLKRRSS